MYCLITIICDQSYNKCKYPQTKENRKKITIAASLASKRGGYKDAGLFKAYSCGIKAFNQGLENKNGRKRRRSKENLSKTEWNGQVYIWEEMESSQRNRKE